MPVDVVEVAGSGASRRMSDDSWWLLVASAIFQSVRLKGTYGCQKKTPQPSSLENVWVG